MCMSTAGSSRETRAKTKKSERHAAIEQIMSDEETAVWAQLLLTEVSELKLCWYIDWMSLAFQ